MDDLEVGRAILASQSFNTLMGATLNTFGDGRAEIALPIREQLSQQYGSVHGGVICYVADNASTFAGGTVLGTSVMTSELKVNYVRPAKGRTLVARATIVKPGKP